MKPLPSLDLLDMSGQVLADGPERLEATIMPNLNQKETAQSDRNEIMASHTNEFEHVLRRSYLKKQINASHGNRLREKLLYIRHLPAEFEVCEATASKLSMLEPRLDRTMQHLSRPMNEC